MDSVTGLYVGKEGEIECPALKAEQWKAEESKLRQLQRLSVVGVKAAVATSYARKALC